MDSFDIGRDLRPALGVHSLSCDGEVDEGASEGDVRNGERAAHNELVLSETLREVVEDLGQID